MFYRYKKQYPTIHPTAYIHEKAVIIGAVAIESDVYIGPGAVLRGDFGYIEVHQGANIQENCVIHMFPMQKTIIKKNVHVGHGAIIHGATIDENCLIGMNSVIMDHVTIGHDCIIGALTMIPQGKEIPHRKVVVGNPAKIVKDVSDDMLKWKNEGTKIYQRLPEDFRANMESCQPTYHNQPIATFHKTKQQNQSYQYQPWHIEKQNTNP